MSENDKKLIEEAKRISRWNYYLVDFLIDGAESEEAKRWLTEYRWALYDSCHESL